MSGKQQPEDLLSKEIEFFESQQAELLRTYPNRYLVIHGDTLEGDYPDFNSALRASVRDHGTEPVLIRRPGDKTETLVAPALALGLL